VDDVECIQKYFEKDIEIVIANSQEDWFSKIEYFIKNPEKRLPIIEAGRSRVLKDHTYENRALQILNIAGLKNKKNYDH
jgi:spore maturation protein CgeB